MRLLEVVWGTVLGAAMGAAASKSAETEPGPVEMLDGTEDADGEDSPLTPVFSAHGFPVADDALRLDTIEAAGSLTASSERGSDGVGSREQDEPVGVESPASSVHGVLGDDKTTPHARSDSTVEPESEVVSKKMSKKEKKERMKKLALLPMGV
jgi:hypothetical protein